MPTEYLEISSVSLAIDGAWRVADLGPLYQSSDARGNDRPIPGSDTVIAYPRRKAPTAISLPLWIFGEKNQSGTPYSDQRVGLVTNLRYLRSNIVGPGVAADGTRPAVLHLPDGTTTLTASVQVEKIIPGAHSPTSWRAILQLVIPAGEFV